MTRGFGFCAAMVFALALAGCEGGGGFSGGAASHGSHRMPTGDGFVTYSGYTAVVAGPGDTVASLARRASVDAGALATFNGISLDTDLRPGDELVLPPRR